MASACEISIIIPVFNEADKLSELLNNIRALRLASAEIIVIDDGSTDGSSDVAMNAGANVIRHPYNIGNGAAIKSGIRAAHGRLLVFMDGDGQHKPQDILKLLAQAKNYHMVVGARAKGSKRRYLRISTSFAARCIAVY